MAEGGGNLVSELTMKPEFVVVACCCILVAASPAVNSQSDGLGQWQLLTNLNFSSQIRLHPHILLIVTVPWSGESQSLMKDVSSLVTNRQEEFNSLELMFMHRNTEKMLAQAIGAIDNEITILYYHNSISYKYQGRLRAQNILFSIYPHIWGYPEEIPLKSLGTPAELKTFLDSTDRALLLLDFCGWTPMLLAKGKKNVTEYDIDWQGETNKRVAPMGKDIQKEMEKAKVMCDVDKEFDGVPWLVDFSSVNGSALEETDDVIPGVSASCTSKEYQQFKSFFSKFMTVAKDFFLPSERHRYGLVSERSMISTLGLGESGTWLALLHFAGCPSCLKIIEKEDDLNDVLQMDNAVTLEPKFSGYGTRTYHQEIITCYTPCLPKLRHKLLESTNFDVFACRGKQPREAWLHIVLEGDGHDLEPVLPVNRPSILLFVDRSSHSLETRSKSKEALDAFRELALHIYNSYQVGGGNSDKREKLFQDYQASRSTSGPPRLKLSRTAQVMKLKEKMSTIMIVNEGKHVTLDKINSDLQGSSLHEILAYLLQQKKEVKLSSVAKELGFQLLSDDIDIKLVNTLPSRTEIQSDPVSPKAEEEDIFSSGVDSDKPQLSHRASTTEEDLPEISKVSDAQLKSQNDEEKIAYLDTNAQLSIESEQDHELDVAVGIDIIDKSSSKVDKSKHQQLQFPGLKGSFYFSDGNYRLLQALTGGSKIPGLVIVDPSVEQHYVFQEENDFSYSSMADFLSRFLNGSLLPYRQSEPVLQSHRKAMKPPFLNVDFHEVDSIPRVTSNSFSEVVIGFNQSESYAWYEDVLVLFGNRWCGFCQRMEMVVREVYRAMRGYISTLKGDNLKDVKLKFPLIYLLDCTLNDCSWILRSLNQAEVYPTLLLFPAEKKNALPYEGHMGVADVIKFIADHGSNSHHLVQEKGIFWSVAKRDGRNQNLIGKTLSIDVHEDVHEEAVTSKDDEVLLANQTSKRMVKHNNHESCTPKGSHGAAPEVVAGSILIATEKLGKLEPFGKSKILIVKADQRTGFQGLIINRHIKWDAFKELEGGLQMLAKAPLSLGGPLMLRGMPLVSLTHRAMEDQYPEVLPGIYYLDQLATYRKLGEFKSGNHCIADYWFFLGYSGWDWDKLFDEIAEGAWDTSDDITTHFGWP